MGKRIYSESTRVKLGRDRNHVKHSPVNDRAYERVVTRLNGGTATLRELADAVPNHPRKGGGWGFIVYLLRRGWLKEAS